MCNSTYQVLRDFSGIQVGRSEQVKISRNSEKLSELPDLGRKECGNGGGARERRRRPDM